MNKIEKIVIFNLDFRSSLREKYNFQSFLFFFFSFVNHLKQKALNQVIVAVDKSECLINY